MYNVPVIHVEVLYTMSHCFSYVYNVFYVATFLLIIIYKHYTGERFYGFHRLLIKKLANKRVELILQPSPASHYKDLAT